MSCWIEPDAGLPSAVVQRARLECHIALAKMKQSSGSNRKFVCVFTTLFDMFNFSLMESSYHQSQKRHANRTIAARSKQVLIIVNLR